MAVLMVAMLASQLSSFVHGCGIEWRVPETHFDGVDELGHVCYSKLIGEIDCGKELKLPLIITFRSDRESSSSYLGKGWILALLDSSFVQTGENAFFMTQPDGCTRPFYRSKVSDPVLDGGPDWKAEINGDTVIVTASCGWKFGYAKGRLARISTPKNRQLDFVWSRGKVAELREAGTTRLAVSYDEATGQALALLFNGKRIEIAQGEKPRVQKVAGQNVIAGMEQSLHRISGADSQADAFDFSVNPQVQPTLKISGNIERTFTWDPASKRITKDNEWSYTFKGEGESADHAIIERKNAQDQVESWERDSGKGVETTLALNGERTITRRFGSGLLAGELRSREVYRGNDLISSEKFQYNEKANLLKVTRNGLTINYDNGRMTRASRDGKPLWEVTYDAAGSVKQVKHFSTENALP